MLRVARLLALLLTLTGVSFGDNVTFLRLDSGILQQHLQNAPAAPQQRLASLRTSFVNAGCPREEILEQAVPGQALPNLICVLRGSENGSIVVGAALEYDSRGDEGALGWASVSLLPLLVESLASAPHRHTYVFVAFAGGDSLAGSTYFVKQISELQQRDIRGMVDVDRIGRTAAQYASQQQDSTLARLLPASARALHLAHMPGEITGVAPTDAQSFERAHIPSITIHSPGFEGPQSGTGKVVSTADAIAPSFRRNTPAAEVAAPSFRLQTTVDPAAYNETYNLLCVYLLFLDRGLGASKKPETLVASAPPAPPVMASPAVSAAPGPGLQREQPPPNSTPIATAPPVMAAVAPSPIPAVTQARATSQAGNPTPVFRASARLVQVDVVVTDKQGRPVRDLQQSDFTVLEDGSPQKVRAFESHQPQTQTAADAKELVKTAAAAQPQPGQTPVYSNFPAKEGATNWTVVLFDILNTPTTDQAYARSQLLQLIKSIPQGQPTAVFVLTQHLEMLQGFTQDPAQLLRAVDLLTPGKSQLLTTQVENDRNVNAIQAAERQSMPTVSVQGTAVSTDGLVFSTAARIMQGYRDHEAFRVNDRVLFTLDAMKAAAQAVSGYPGRKNLLWLSGSFPVQINPDPGAQEQFRNMQGFQAAINGASALLATSRVAVYPIDVRGMQTRGIDISIATAENTMMSDPLPSGSSGVVQSSPDKLGSSLTEQAEAQADERTTMNMIARQTGGEAFVNTNDLKRAMQRSLEDGTSYYTLAYTPPKDDAAGGYHRIDVKLEKPGLKLAYRRGYYLVPLTSSTVQGTAALRSALQPGMPPATMMFLSAMAQPPDAGHKETRVHYVISANQVSFQDVAGDKKHAVVDCMVIAFDKEGHEVGHASDTLDATFPASAYDMIMSRGLPAQQELNLAPGLYTLRIGVMDRTTQNIGTVNVPLAIAGSAVAQR